MGLLLLNQGRKVVLCPLLLLMVQVVVVPRAG
jgi:hypothetical protein